MQINDIAKRRSRAKWFCCGKFYVYGDRLERSGSLLLRVTGRELFRNGCRRIQVFILKNAADAIGTTVRPSEMRSIRHAVHFWTCLKGVLQWQKWSHGWNCLHSDASLTMANFECATLLDIPNTKTGHKQILFRKLIAVIKMNHVRSCAPLSSNVSSWHMR